ncbi:MAG TPA: MFS transporter [Pyrinomonadaceae bacterium]|jgi:FHS family glucose/mannose:H+ symporter-like MFS transporter|nr:MFS transporter [Pyrinomonadaceae bacterium]
MPPTKSSTTRVLKILLHAGFFVSGIATVIIGQLLPILKDKFVLNDEQLGNFFPAQFAGSLIGTFLTNWFGKRNRFLLASLLGCFLMGAGVLMLNAGSYELCLSGFFVNGLGIGLTLPSINMLILELNPMRAAAALSVLNFFWGVGAIISQPFVDFFARGTNIFTPTVCLSIVLLIIGIALVLMPKEIEQKPAASGEEEIDFSVPIWTNPVAWMIAFFNFIHVGYESAMGGWLKTYTQRVEDGAAMNLLPPITLYFVFFVVGRGVAPIFFRFLNENKMLFLSLLTILLGMGILLSARNVWLLSVGASIAGFGTSSVFPTNMSRFTKTFGASASRRATPFFICGTLGAAFTTWFIGYVSNRFDNDLRSGMFILLGSIAAIIFLQTILQFQKKPATALE